MVKLMRPDVLLGINCGTACVSLRPVSFLPSGPQIFSLSAVLYKRIVQGINKREILVPFEDSTTLMSHAPLRNSDSGVTQPRSAESLQSESGTNSSRHTAEVGDNSTGSHSGTNLHAYFSKQSSGTPSPTPLQADNTLGKKRRTSNSSLSNHSAGSSSSQRAKRRRRTSTSAESPGGEEAMSSLPSHFTSPFKNGVNPVIRSNSTESGSTNVTKPRQAKKLVIKNLKGEQPSLMWQIDTVPCLCVYGETCLCWTSLALLSFRTSSIRGLHCV